MAPILGWLQRNCHKQRQTKRECNDRIAKTVSVNGDVAIQQRNDPLLKKTTRVAGTQPAIDLDKWYAGCDDLIGSITSQPCAAHP